MGLIASEEPLHFVNLQGFRLRQFVRYLSDLAGYYVWRRLCGLPRGAARPARISDVGRAGEGETMPSSGLGELGASAFARDYHRPLDKSTSEAAAGLVRVARRLEGHGVRRCALGVLGG